MSTSSTIRAALASLGYFVKQDGKKTVGSLPDTYLTYFVITEIPERGANNRDRMLNSRVQVSMWSTDEAKTDGARGDITAAMKAAGFLFINGNHRPFNGTRYGWRGDYRLYTEME